MPIGYQKSDLNYFVNIYKSFSKLLNQMNRSFKKCWWKCLPRCCKKKKQMQTIEILLISIRLLFFAIAQSVKLHLILNQDKKSEADIIVDQHKRLSLLFVLSLSLILLILYNIGKLYFKYHIKIVIDPKLNIFWNFSPCKWRFHTQPNPENFTQSLKNAHLQINIMTLGNICASYLQVPKEINFTFFVEFRSALKLKLVYTLSQLEELQFSTPPSFQ